MLIRKLGAIWSAESGPVGSPTHLDRPPFQAASLGKKLFKVRDAQFGRAFARTLMPADASTFLLVSLYSLGDTYLLCALARAFRKTHCAAGQRLTLAVRRSHFAIAELFNEDFDRIFLLDPVEVDRTIGHLHRHRIRSGFGPDEGLFLHPHHVNDTRIDDFTNLEGVSQANMYAHLMRIPIASPLSAPVVRADRQAEAEALCRQLGFVKGRTAVLVPDSNSWPQLPEAFWQHMPAALSKAGWTVFTNSAGNRHGPRTEPLPGSRLADIPLELAMPMLSYAGWAIGALCGFMNVVISSQASCKKTVLVRGPAEGTELRFNEMIKVQSAFPYAYQRKFDGSDYDIEELQIRDDADYAASARMIASGFNAAPTTIAAVEPTRRMSVPLPPGEVADRITVLEVKLEKLPPEKSILVLKELAVLRQTLESFAGGISGELAAKMALLRDLNREGWEMNEVIYRTFDDPAFGSQGWKIDPSDQAMLQTADAVTRAFRASQAANRKRILVKNDINRMLSSTWLEQKSFES